MLDLASLSHYNGMLPHESSVLWFCPCEYSNVVRVQALYQSANVS